jgi:hypothetical protein
MVSPGGLLLVGIQGDNVTRNLSFVGTANGTIEVQLYTSDLTDNSTGNMFSTSQLLLNSTQFSISRNEQENVGITAITKGVSLGTYQGSILVVSNQVNANSSTLSIGVSIRVEPPKSLFGSIYQTVIIGAIIALSIIGFIYGQSGPWRTTEVIVSISIAIASIWVYTVINYTFNDVNTIISTVLIAPFLAYSANFLTEKRSEQNSKATASATVLKDGTKDDVELIRNIMGELVTHYASFDPYRYSKNDLSTRGEAVPSMQAVNNETTPEEKNEIFTPEILFHKSGVLTRDTWDKSCKQGRVADLPILRLEKYYDFIQIYNRYYSCAMILTAEKTEEQFKNMAKTPFFVRFSAFRKAYRDLENVLFANLSYDIGLFTKNNLSPLDVQPRFTRPLIKKLFEYEILDPATFFTDLSDEKIKSKFPEETDAKKLQEFKKNEGIKLVDDWKITERNLKKISKISYNKNKVSIFYDEVENDFQRKYETLLSSIRDLLFYAPLPQGFVDSEKAATFSQESSTFKDLLDDLDKLKKLSKDHVITPAQFECWKKKILDNTLILKDKPRLTTRSLEDVEEYGSICEKAEDDEEKKR